jgi:general secretion pathway protein H
MLSRQCSQKNSGGFTLLELLITIAIAGLLLSVSVPATTRFYQSMQYRKAIRDVITMLDSARYRAINTGRMQDVGINPKTGVMRLGKDLTQIPEEITIAVHSAQEVNQQDEGVIRFYPEGGSSGGDIDLERSTGGGVKITVDWLTGRVTHETYSTE